MCGQSDCRSIYRVVLMQSCQRSIAGDCRWPPSSLNCTIDASPESCTPSPSSRCRSRSPFRPAGHSPSTPHPLIGEVHYLLLHLGLIRRHPPLGSQSPQIIDLLLRGLGFMLQPMTSRLQPGRLRSGVRAKSASSASGDVLRRMLGVDHLGFGVPLQKASIPQRPGVGMGGRLLPGSCNDRGRQSNHLELGELEPIQNAH